MEKQNTKMKCDIFVNDENVRTKNEGKKQTTTAEPNFVVKIGMKQT